MHAITTRSPTGIQEKWLPLLVPIQDSVKIPAQKQPGEYIKIVLSAEATREKLTGRTDGKRTSLFAGVDVACVL